MAEPDPVLTEVLALERALLDPAVRRDRARVRGLLHDDFREIGASGALWSRDQIVAALAAESAVLAPRVRVRDEAARFVLGDVVLVTYLAISAAGRSLRSSLWVRDPDDGGWRMLFHQGTPAAA